MEEQAQRHVTDLMTIYQATFIDLPLAGAKWSWGGGLEREVAQAAWRGYDAWVRLASASIDKLYKNSLFVYIAINVLDRSLRWRRLSQTLAGAFFAGLWPAVGLPTATVVQALTEELQSLTARLNAQDLQIQALREELRSLTVDSVVQRRRRAVPHDRIDASLKAWSRKTNGHRTVASPTVST
jgi:hypothetical protein